MSDITREEAKSRLEYIYKNHKCLSLESPYCYEAIKMGAEALEKPICDMSCARMEIIVNNMVKELEKIKQEIGKEFVDLQDGSEEWRSYVNEAVLSCYEIIEKHIEELKGENK